MSRGWTPTLIPESSSSQMSCDNKSQISKALVLSHASVSFRKLVVISRVSLLVLKEETPSRVHTPRGKNNGIEANINGDTRECPGRRVSFMDILSSLSAQMVSLDDEIEDTHNSMTRNTDNYTKKTLEEETGQTIVKFPKSKIKGVADDCESLSERNNNSINVWVDSSGHIIKHHGDGDEEEDKDEHTVYGPDRQRCNFLRTMGLLLWTASST